MSIRLNSVPADEAFIASLEHIPYMAAFDFGRYLIAATTMFVVGWLLKKTIWGYRQIQPRLADSSDYRREFFASLRTCAVFVVAGVGISFGIRTGFLQEVQISLGLWRDVATFAAIIVAHDAYFYWTHRAMHHPRLFKRFHRLHHRSVTPTPFAAYAFDVPEAIVMVAFMPLWLFFVPTAATVISGFLAFMIIRNVMGHAGLELHARWWLNTPLTSWINTTTHHDLHHCGGFNRNYGLYFTWWDRMMGTEHEDYGKEFASNVARPKKAAGGPTSVRVSATA